MADKQSVINLAWNLDTSNFDKARTMTNNLKQSFEDLRSPLVGANDAINQMHSHLSSIKDGYRGINSMAKSVYNNNKGINDTLRVAHTNSRNLMDDYSRMNSKIDDMTSNYKNVLATSAKLTASTQKTVIATQQLRQSLLDLNKVKPSAPSAPIERPSSIGGSHVVSGTVKDHSLRNTAIGGGIAGIVGSGMSMLGGYITNSAKQALQADQGVQKLQLAWQTMGVKSSASIRSLTGQVGQLGKMANTNASDVVQTQKILYNATNGNVNKTKELTDAMFAYGRASGATDHDIASASVGLTRLFNTSKVRGNIFTRVMKQAPYMRNAIIQASGESAKHFMSDMDKGKISGQELEQLMVKSARNSGQAWAKYGNTAQGALARLQGSQKAIWKATMSGMANETNSGIVQMSKLISKNIKPISKMMIGVGNAGAKVVDSVITFLVKNQKPLGSIAHSLISIVGTIGKSVWKAFSGVIQAIGTAFGVLTGNAGKSNNPLQTTANILNDIAKHKGAIEAITYAFAGMFMIKKAQQFAGALKQVATSVGLVNDAENGGNGSGKGGLLSNILSNGTYTGRSLKGNNIASKISGKTLASGFKDTKPSAFKEARSVAVSGAYHGDSKGTNLMNKTAFTFANTEKTGLLSKLVGSSSKFAGMGAKLASVAGKSKVLSFLGKVPGLDYLTAGSQLIGMNRHNAGSKLGSAGGMLGGTMAGSAIGTAILPGVGTAIGGAIGGIAGSSYGQKIGSWFQHKLPGVASRGWKAVKREAGREWNGTVTMFKHGGQHIAHGWNAIKKGSSHLWNGIKSGAKSSWNRVTSAFGNGWRKTKSLTSRGWNGTKSLFGKGWNLLKRGAKNNLHILSTGFGKAWTGVKNNAGHIWAGMRNNFSNEMKLMQRIFGVFKDVFSGNWKKAWTDAKSIFTDVWNGIKDTFSNVFNTIKDSISSFFGKVGHFMSHPIQSIKSGLHLATGTHNNGLKHDTHAILNDGNGREIVRYPNGQMIRPNGTNVHMMLPAGSEVYNANDTRRLINRTGMHFGVHYARGTRNPGFNNKHASFGSTIHVKFDGMNMKSALVSTRKYTNQVIRLIRRAYTGINRSSNTSLRKMFRQSQRLWKTNNRNMRRELTLMNKQNAKTWRGIDRDTNRQQKVINRTAERFSKELTKSLTSEANEMNKQLNKIWESITSDFKSIFAKLGPYAHSGMNGAINQLNSGISGIDKTLGQFGGNTSVLSPIKYAEGTDAVDHTHLAMVNDAKSGFQDEAIISPNGGVRYAYGRNALTVLHKGESVLNGADTHEAISKGYIPRHASGVGSKKTLRRLASQNAKDYVGAFNTEFSDNVKLAGPDLQKGIIRTGRSASASSGEGYNWSHAMWAVIHNAMNSMGSATGLLKAVEKYGTGHKYVWGATGPDAFDCSGLVQYALKQMGIDYPRTSGEQIAKAQHISRSQARPGDLIGNSEHIGVVADNGAHHYFSAFNPSMHPNILMTPVNGSYFPGTPQFGRVGGISHQQSSGSGIKGVSKQMQSLVKSQLGSKALSWLKKTFSDSIGASGNPAGDGVQRWKPDVIKALRALGLSTSGDMIDRVLRQINTESGGNPNAVGGTDGLNDGRAMGLMQVKPGTFSAYGKPGLGGWNNGMASIYAGLNYAKHRYGPSLSFLGQGHGYAKGGRPPLHQPVLVGENGPEIAQFDYPVNIHSNAESKRMASKFGSVTVNPNITINVKGSANKEDAMKTAKQFREQMLDMLGQIFTDAEIDQGFNN